MTRVGNGTLVDRSRVYRIFAVCLLLISGGVYAGVAAPLPQANRNPLVSIYGLPLALSGKLLEPGQQQWMLAFTLANTFRLASRDNELVYFDGETSNARLAWRYGVGDKWEFGVALPVVHHDGGFLDPMIDAYHRAFGFDRAHRDELPFGRSHFQYNKDGRVHLLMQGEGTGIGDLQLDGAYQLHNQQQRWLAARFSLKVPTGDADMLYGSGGWDTSVGLHWADREAMAAYRLSYELSLGLLYTSDGEILPQQRRNWVGYGSALLAWQAVRWANLKLQLDGNTAFYHSAMREIGAASAQLSIGATFAATRKLGIDLAITEDLVVDTAPDLTLLLAFRYQF